MNNQYFKRFFYFLNIWGKNVKVLRNIQDKNYVFNSLERYVHEDNLKYIKSLYNYELEIFQLISTRNIEEVFNRRLNNKKKLYEITETDKLKILEKEFLINKNNTVVENKYNWLAFYSNNIGKQSSGIIDKNITDTYFIYIMPTIFERVRYNEFLLNFEFQLLIDLWNHDDSFFGYEIIDIVFENSNKDNGKKGRVKLENDVSEILLYYITYFDALKIL